MVQGVVSPGVTRSAERVPYRVARPGCRCSLRSSRAPTRARRRRHTCRRGGCRASASRPTLPAREATGRPAGAAPPRRPIRPAAGESNQAPRTASDGPSTPHASDGPSQAADGHRKHGRRGHERRRFRESELDATLRGRDGSSDRPGATRPGRSDARAGRRRSRRRPTQPRRPTSRASATSQVQRAGRRAGERLAGLAGEPAPRQAPRRRPPRRHPPPRRATSRRRAAAEATQSDVAEHGRHRPRR